MLTNIKFIIKEALTSIGYDSPNMENLLFATCCNESDCGTYEVQRGGPARGIMQCENATYQDVVHNFLAYHPDLKAKIFQWQPHNPSNTADDLVGNPRFATCIAACSYIRHSSAMSAIQNNELLTLDQMYAIYKEYYNGPGAAVQSLFEVKYNKYSPLCESPNN